MNKKPIFYLMTLGLSGCFGEGVKLSDGLRRQYGGMPIHEIVTMERRKELERRQLSEEMERQRGGAKDTAKDARQAVVDDQRVHQGDHPPPF